MTPARARKKPKKRSQTTAFHAQQSDSGINVVGFGNLQVYVIQEEPGVWFARSQEINYAAQGNSLEDVQHNFERGLIATVDEHLRVFGHIKNLLSQNPRTNVRQHLSERFPQSFRYSQLTVHALPEKLQQTIQFENIAFIRPLEETAPVA
jgi:hypothetical protein